MKVLIRPKKLKGIIDVVPSKSYSHRAIIAASLADGVSVIKNVLFSDDINRTISCCKAFGAEIEKYENYIVVKGAPKVKRVNNSVNVGESGSTIRFMIPIMLTSSEQMTFTGENNLVNRPLDSFFEIFEKQNVEYIHPEKAYLPLETKGGLKSDDFFIKGNVSSQFITGLLFALPLLDGDSTINIVGNLESKAYIDLTLDILSLYGIKVENKNYQQFVIRGNQKYQPHDYVIEGDFSQAAFFLSMGALGNDVSLGCMNLSSLQGDRKIIEDIKDLGGEIIYDGKLLKALPAKLVGTTIDLSQSPDLGPTLSVLASLSEGETKFVNASRLRIKECDRITCVKEELNKLGAYISESPEEMYFKGVEKLNGSLELDSHNDHRIAMSLAVASTVCCDNLLIHNAECVKKSYPHFWSDFVKLGGDIDVID